MKIKNTLFFLSLCCIVLFSSCGSEDEDGISPTADNIQGSWTVTDLEYQGTSTTEIPDFPALTSSFTGVAINSDFTMTLDESNISTSGSYDVELTTTFLGQSSTSTIPGSDLPFGASGAWNLNGDQLTITPTTGEPATFTIANMTDNSFQLKFDVVNIITEDDGFGDEIRLIYDYEGTMTLTK